MPSSISSSDPAAGGQRASVTAAPAGLDRYSRAAAVALVCLVLLVVLLEAGTRLVFDRFSRIGKRIATEYAAARSVSSPGVLIAGNSLLLEGVNFPDLEQKAAQDGIHVSRFVIENTSWIDWYYGVRRLLAEGSRPQILVLCLNTPQLMSSTIRGDYSSFYLFQARDIPAVAREAHLSLTQASSSMLAHYSRFYADRTNLRSFLLNRIDPAYVGMVGELTASRATPPASAEIERVAEARLRELKAAGDAAGVRCVLLIPPGFIAGEEEIRAAGARVGAEVWVPIPQGTLPHSDYLPDDYHLNPQGAAVFTQAVANQLKSLMPAAK